MNSQFVARCAASAREFTPPANRTACRGARMTGAFLCSVILTAGTPGLSQTRSQTPGVVVGWGEQVIPYVQPGTRFTAIAAGGSHSLALKADGTVQFNLSGIVGLSYTPQASTNLVDWVPVLSFVSINGTTTVADPAATNFNCRFYRARTP